MSNPSKKIENKFLRGYDKYGDAIFRFFYFRVHNQELAKDLVQETYIKVWKYLSEGKEVTKLKPFLYTVARNLVIDYSRKKKDLSLENLTEKGFQVQVDNLEAEHLKIDVQIFLKNLHKVNQKYAEVLQLRYIDGLRPKDIAGILGETQNVVSVRIHRGKQELKKILDYEKDV